MMNRYEVDYSLDNSKSVFYIFDTFQQRYLKDAYSSFEYAQEDCDILNEQEEIDNWRCYG
jgi:hypothetical protein